MCVFALQINAKQLNIKIGFYLQEPNLLKLSSYVSITVYYNLVFFFIYNDAMSCRSNMSLYLMFPHNYTQLLFMVSSLLLYSQSISCGPHC